MKKIISWSLLLVAILVGIGIINFSLYETQEELFNFPIPKNAELINEKELGNSYTWSKASFENGIPLGYSIVLWANGWKKGEIMGGSVLYTKGNHTIDLITTHEHLDILKVNN